MKQVVYRVTRNLCLLCALTLMLSIGAHSVRAQVLLKPNGQNAMPLRAKKLAAKVDIAGQFATTNLLMTFQNETSQRIEADFIYSAPPGAVVTYFAYWYEDEKVVARIVERERAAQIYQHITSRMRDPALIEMIGKNTFRARIFPIMPDADLKVEMCYVQVLASNAQGPVYTLPLRPQKAGTGTLEELDVELRIAKQTQTQKVINNYKLPVLANATSYTLKFSQRNYRAQQDLQIGQIQKLAHMRASLYAARSGGSNGFFALTLMPDRTVKNPQISILGVSTYDVVAFPQTGHTSSPLVWCGRYRGQGKALVSLSGRNLPGKGLQQYVTFSALREDNNLATKLWAARRIEVLGKSEKNRDAVTKLSTRFTLPCVWTSWLAVPKAEIERYREEMLGADLVTASRAMALEVARGRAKSARATQLRRQVYSLAKRLGSDPKSELATQYVAVLQTINQRLLQERYKKRPNAKNIRTWNAHARRLKRAIQQMPDASYYEENLWQDEAQIASRALADEVRGNGNNTRHARRLRNRLKSIEKYLGYSPEHYVRSAGGEQMRELARQMVQNEYSNRPSASRSAQWKVQLSRLSRVAFQSSQDVLRDARREYADTRLSTLANELGTHITNGEESSAKAKQLRLEIEMWSRRAEYKVTEVLQNQWAWKLDELRRGEAEAVYEFEPDTTRIQQLQTQRERLEKAANGGRSTDNWVRYSVIDAKLSAGHQRYVEELRKPKPDAKLVARLETYLNRLSSDPAYRNKDDWFWNKDEKVSVDRDKPLDYYKVKDLRKSLNTTDEEIAQLDASSQKTQLAKLTEKRTQTVDHLAYATRYYLRIGDPLIAINASENALQVIAILPNGEIKKLLWNAQNKRWEARFDVPAYAVEGEYLIRIIVVQRDGARQQLAMNYHVDMTSPGGVGQATRVSSQQRVLKLTFQATSGTTRVSALLPWGDKVELKPSTVAENRFLATVVIPQTHTGVAEVTYILTDKAHNRTVVTVDMESSGGVKPLNHMTP